MLVSPYRERWVAGLPAVLLLCKGRYSQSSAKEEPTSFLKGGADILREPEPSAPNVAIKEAQSEPADKKRIKYFYPPKKNFGNLINYYLSLPIACS